MTQAQLQLQLQKAKLQQAESLNRKVPNTVSDSDLNNLRLNLALAEKLLESATDGDTGARKNAYLHLAYNAVLAAESELHRAEEVRKQISGRFSEEDIEVLKLKVALAKVNLAIGKEAFAGSVEDELRWKIDLLSDEVLNLRNELKQVRGRR